MSGRRLWAAAFIAYFWAWLLPSLITHVFFGEEWRFAGWEATLIALSPIVPGHFGATPDWSDWPWLLLDVASALTNLLFVAALVLTVRWPERVNTRWERAIWLAALLNTNWFARSEYRDELRIGYYLWVFSFALLGLALRTVRRENDRVALQRAAA